MKIHQLLKVLFFSLLLLNCKGGGEQNNEQKPGKSSNIFSIEAKVLEASKQYTSLVKVAKGANNLPRTIEDEKLRFINDRFDWTEGFFPGSLWYLYELTGEEKWKENADFFQAMNFDDRFFSNHDLGFIFNCSYGNGLRLTGNESYKTAMIDAANTLLARFKPSVGLIKSWNVDSGWQSERGWQYPVIIDNMMNLELLFVVSEMTGDDKYKEAAISHANNTILNHYRENMSCYHVVDYDSLNGEVRSKQTAQGYAHESAWARGQAWGLYGYTLCYRFTKDKKYLDQAMKVAEFILANKSAKEGIPYWDYDAPNIPNEPVDASAAAITASALIELSEYTEANYLEEAKKLIGTLSGDAYFAKVGENKNFLLMHSVGSIPHNNEIDVPLNYADYYYLEALARLKKK